jgi:hypothetical protein
LAAEAESSMLHNCKKDNFRNGPTFELVIVVGGVSAG